MRTLSRELGDWQRTADSMFSTLPRSYNSWWDVPYTFSGPIHPLFDLEQKEHEFILRFDMPGVDSENVHICPRSQGIEIQADKNQEVKEYHDKFYRQEREQRGFHRYCVLGEDADVKNTKARLRNGVLEIRVPRIPTLTSNMKEIEVRT